MDNSLKGYFESVINCVGYFDPKLYRHIKHELRHSDTILEYIDRCYHSSKLAGTTAVMLIRMFKLYRK